MTVKYHHLTTVNLKEFSYVDNFEVHGPGTLFMTTDTDTAAEAKKVALLVWNKKMTKAEAETEIGSWN